MQEPNEAKFAFKKLAYTNFKHYPLYLEWAPEDVFTGPASMAELPIMKTKPKAKEQKQTGSKICVKNIPFEATEKDIHKIFG